MSTNTRREFRPIGDLASLDGSLCMPPLGTTFDLGNAIRDGEGVIVTTDPYLAYWLSTIPVMQEVTPGTGQWGEPVPFDSFGERFYDRSYRRRMSG